MEIHIIKRDNKPAVAVLIPRTEINMASYEVIETAARAEHTAGVRHMVIDLTHVRYMSSAGIRLLHGVFKLLRTDDPAETDEALSKGYRDGKVTTKHLKLVGPNESVSGLLKTSGIGSWLSVFATTEEALDSF